MEGLGMDDNAFSLKARRTTRIPLRIPVILVFRENEADKERTIDAWTLIVNVNGARIECKHLFEMHQEVVIRVPHLGKSQKGAIVWRDPNANEKGGFECGIKLDKAENLWGVGFPPSDWTLKSTGIDDLLPSQPAPASKPPDSMEPQTSQSPCVESQGADLKQEHPAPLPIPVEPVMGAEGVLTGGGSALGQAQEHTCQATDLTQDLSALAATETAQPSLELLLQDRTPEPARAAECAPIALEPLPAFQAGFAPAYEEPRLRIGQDPFTPATPTPTANGANSPSDRLSTFFQELVESALQQRVQGLVEGLAARMEARIAEIEMAAVTQVEQRVTTAVVSQSDLLERRAREIVLFRQSALEEDVRQYLASQEETARRTQQDMIQETLRTTREEMSQTAAATYGRLLQQAEEIAAGARANLWQNVQQELPAIEKEVFARGHAQAEQAVSSCFDEMTRRLPERIQEAEQSLKQQMDRVVEERLSQFTAGLAARSEQLQAESHARIEQQIQEVWKQTSQVFLRHIVSELNQKKQAWMQEAEGNLKNLADQNLAWTRRRMTQLLKNLGASLVERADEVAAGAEQVAKNFGKQEEEKETQEMSRLIEAHVGE
jgi:hypothetical protein